MKKQRTPEELLAYLNDSYLKVHTTFEKLFWLSAMGDGSVNKRKDQAKSAFNAFRNDSSLLQVVREMKKDAKGTLRQRLSSWEDFFALHQTPPEAVSLKKKITELETRINHQRAIRKEGYIDPTTKKFVPLSINAMRSLMTTADDESFRKAYFDAIQTLARSNVSGYVKLVGLRNKYAQLLGFSDFYAYNIALEEKMTKKELFSLFGSIYKETKYAFKNIRALEKEKPGLRKPWNYGYMMAGSFIKEEDEYFPFEEALTRWGKSFAALGIDYKGGTLVLDLLDRKGKYNNGFCHWPELVHFREGKRFSGSSDFTCNVVLGTPGESEDGYLTLFHEGGHAAHLLNAEMPDVCLNSEYPPLSTAWAETQSMFLDRVFSSIEWRSRYAKNEKGIAYPFDLFERQLRALHVASPLSFMSYMMVPHFEKEIYETKNLNEEKVLAIARKHFKKHTDRSVDSISILEVPHIYSADSSCSYHGYGLAVLALTQWRDYIRKKYGYIVDNPQVGKEMKNVWKYGGSKSFPEFVKLATGKKLSPDPYIEQATMSLEKKIQTAKKHVEVLSKKPAYTKKINLNTRIVLAHGKKIISDNKNGFEAMARKYASWLKTQYPKKVAEKSSRK